MQCCEQLMNIIISEEKSLLKVVNYNLKEMRMVINV